ncbi:hypothetical protein [Thiothrix subterranea]|uniref:Lipoprotein n=1 Tax=Thiothrix subterranea TaxID=2735563 RepID=A0AA51MQG8_9GAMM|nr:hypothetical protein [Thiothrix subterranea]MDQ5766925.1 hypothetical protein [Thiothrix subterranea]WML88213.1 hypothetical protein RCG00_07510 [Thiothrix subterranea]
MKLVHRIATMLVLVPLMSACQAEEIPTFSGAIKTDDERSAESLALAQEFNAFMMKNDGKTVKLDISNYYDFGDEDLKRDESGFPDPREFIVTDDCETLPMCTGTSYTIDADLSKLDYDPSHSSRSIRGVFEVAVAGMGQGSWAINLKHLPDAEK